MNKFVKEMDNNNQIDEVFDLRIIFNIINRSKFFILICTFSSSMFGTLYAFNKPQLWQGSFEIILESDKKQNNNNISPIIEKLQISNQSFNNSIDTTVGILKSPSVLNPVYLFAKSQKKQNGKNVRSLTYKKWVTNYLNVNLIDKTQILEIKYKGNDKNLLKPVLNKISKTYQKYSTTNKSEEISSSIKFVSNELLKAKKEFKDISRKMQVFQKEHNLGDDRGLPTAIPTIKQPFSNNASINPIKSENAKSSIDRKMRRFDYHYENLKRLESDLVLKSAIYKPESKIIKALRDSIEVIKESLARPGEIIFEYNNILRDYYKKESIVSNLEVELYNLKFSKAKQLKPWKLITEVTIKDNPIAPNKKLIIFAFTIFGLITSILFKLFESKTSKLIYNSTEFSNILKSLPVLKFPKLKDKNWDESMVIFEEIIKKYIDQENLVIFILSEKKEVMENKTIINLSKKINSMNLVLTNKMDDIDEFSNIFFVACSGDISSNQIELIQSKLKVLNCNYLGWAFLEMHN